MSEIDHSYTDELVCPHCGHVYEDSWEFHGDSGDDECEECGKSFKWCRSTSIAYSTERVEDESTAD